MTALTLGELVDVRQQRAVLVLDAADRLEAAVARIDVDCTEIQRAMRFPFMKKVTGPSLPTFACNAT